MQYFLIVFSALMAFLGIYILDLQNKNHELIKQLSALEATYNAVRKSQNLTLEYASKELDSAKNRIKKIELNNETCQTELNSYKRLIRAF